MFVNGQKSYKTKQTDQSPGGTEWQTGSWSRQAEWSGRRIQSPETGKGQNREDYQKENSKRRTGKHTG